MMDARNKTERVNIYEMACATASPSSAKMCYLSKWGNKRTFLKEEISIRKSIFSKINGLTRASVAKLKFLTVCAWTQPGFLLLLTSASFQCHSVIVTFCISWTALKNVQWTQNLYKRLYRVTNLTFCYLMSLFPANTQRRNNVVTTSLQRHDVAATL